MPERQTYDAFVLFSVAPVSGWSAVYYDEGEHIVAPIHALAVVERRRYYCGTGRRERVPSPHLDEEMREVVGMAYDADGGFEVVDSMSNYCGLLSPGRTLEDFAEGSICRYAHEAEAEKKAKANLERAS